MMKKMIAFLISSMMAIVCISFNVDAKVIEPEVVKTEKWTTSYYIDDDVVTLYPYIRCEADIYNDGTIKLYMWNTHEWSGFATVSHRATIVQSIPYSQASAAYSYYKKTPYSSDGRSYQSYPIKNYTDKTPDYTAFQNISYYSDKYTIAVSPSYIGSRWSCSSVTYYYSWSNSSDYTNGYIEYCAYGGPLPNMTFQEIRPNHPVATLTPAEDPTGTYEFRLFGRDITITPELLSGNTVSEPVLTEQEQYIKQLEEENKKLKEQLNLLSISSCGDIDGDGDISVEDAQLLLQYYTESKVARLTDKPIKDWYTEKYGSK